jgi:hypothetical protein
MGDICELVPPGIKTSAGAVKVKRSDGGPQLTLSQPPVEWTMWATVFCSTRRKYW